jgi:hypothetical protein
MRHRIGEFAKMLLGARTRAMFAVEVYINHLNTIINLASKETLQVASHTACNLEVKSVASPWFQ